MKSIITPKKIPNLSLLLGYITILMIIGLFSMIQYSSTNSLNNIEMELRSQILRVSKLSPTDIQEAESQFELWINTPIYSQFFSTFADNNLAFTETFESRDQFIDTLESIGAKLDAYRIDLQRSQGILFITFIGLSIILSVLIAISEFDQMKRLERESNKRINDKNLLEVLENERNLLAVELHDDVAQKLSIISQHFGKSDKEEHTELLVRYNSDVIHKIRTMAYSLRSPEFNLHDFQKQIEFMFSDFKSVSRIKLHATFHGLSALVMDEEKMLHIYRIVQEILSNCRKHSSASSVSISFLYVHPELRIMYDDDGVGMDIDGEYEGLGLKSIQYRLRILDALIEKSSENGLNMKIIIPVEI